MAEDAVRSYAFVNHDCRASDLVPVGKLMTGAVVKINRRAAEASFRIGIGSVFPHPLNGFGGGGKILFPGISDFDAILEHHLRYSFRAGSELGRLQGNPFHEEVSSLSVKAGLHFIVNGVLDHNDRLYAIVSGDPVAAHWPVSGSAPASSLESFPEGRSDGHQFFPLYGRPQIVKPLAPGVYDHSRGWHHHSGGSLYFTPA